jgi:LysM repeat protein
MPDHPRSQARLVAPIALAVVGILFFAIVLSAGSGGGGGKEEGPAPATHKKKHDKVRSKAKAPRSTYTVKAGDSLATIAEKTGVDVDKLQELNPQLDPQGLVTGQKIKLRE